MNSLPKSGIQIPADVKLHDETIAKLLSWSGNLPEIRRRFFEAGFQVPGLTLDFVEGLRARREEELSYDLYLDEVFREALQLKRGLWSVGSRKALPLVHRSTILDRLEAFLEAGELGEKVSQNLHAILDPNFLLYSRLMIDSSSVWEEHLLKLRERKQVEIEFFRDEIHAMSNGSSSLKASSISKTIRNIAESHGLQYEHEKGRLQRDILGVEIVDGVSIYLQWSDYHVLQKRGNLDMIFVIQESERPIWAPGEFKAWPFAASLSSFLPNGDFYARRNEDWSSIVLGLLAHAKFLSLCGENALAHA